MSDCGASCRHRVIWLTIAMLISTHLLQDITDTSRSQLLNDRRGAMAFRCVEAQNRIGAGN